MKPLYKGMVRKIVIPTRSNVAGAERCLKMERILGSAYGGNHFNEIKLPEINPILWNRFESEYKTTANLMEEVDDQINTICDLASELVKDIEATFLEEVEDPEIDPEHLAKKVVCPDNSVRWDNHTENYWNQEREQLIRLALETHFECFYELRHQEYLLSKKFTKLDNQLVDIEDQLREEYGIPFQDIEQPF